MNIKTLLTEKYLNPKDGKRGMVDDEQNFEEVYDDEAAEDLVENDEISPEEEAFMKGYNEQKDESKDSSEGDEAYEKAFEEESSKK